MKKTQGKIYEIKNNDIIIQNKVFAWVLLATGMILMIPLAVMQFSSEWDWDVSDFVVVGTLLSGMGSMFVVTARRINRKYRFFIGILFSIALLYIWAELAVGIFTNLGN